MLFHLNTFPYFSLLLLKDQVAELLYVVKSYNVWVFLHFGLKHYLLRLIPLISVVFIFNFKIARKAGQGIPLKSRDLIKKL